MTHIPQDRIDNSRANTELRKFWGLPKRAQPSISELLAIRTVPETICARCQGIGGGP